MANTHCDSGILGIDAGGTFADLAFLSGKPLQVAAKAKTPTLHEDLIHTIAQGMDLILRQVDRDRIRTVNLATTLATNAIVEDKLRPAGLILIGYDSVEPAGRRGEFGTQLVYRVGGGHDARGNEAAPLDEAALEQAARELAPRVESLAISGYFSVRNTSHELRAREIVQRLLPQVPITCGHELATDLDAVKRATTAALNAGLIPIVMGLLHSVEQVCASRGIHAPITVVRGDGSLVSAEWAARHPIEMVLSGPASSACGACYLAGAANAERPSWAVDIGGTTTDIIGLDRTGRPAISAEGALVGRHRTLVKAIDIDTFGLGGDSRTRFDRERRLVLGPRRIRPLCVAALEYPEMLGEMERLLKLERACEPLFVFPGPRMVPAMSGFETRVFNKLSRGPCSVAALLEEEPRANSCQQELENLAALGRISFSGFTPTDALHILGSLDRWDGRASRLGARLMSLESRQTPEELARAVCGEAVRMMALQVFRKSLVAQNHSLRHGGTWEALLAWALEREEEREAGSRLRLELNAALIGVGAPSWAFIGQAGELLGERAILPEHAEVAGAVGAAVGSFSLNYAVLIRPLPRGGVRVHHPLGVRDYKDLETAVSQTKASMLPWIRERARKAGAADPQVSCDRRDDEAWVTGGSRKVYLRTQLFFTVSDEGRDAE